MDQMLGAVSNYVVSGSRKIAARVHGLRLAWKALALIPLLLVLTLLSGYSANIYAHRKAEKLLLQIRTLEAGKTMGDVYKTHDTKLRRDVAIKVLPESLARDADRLARFRREAQLLASLNHTNIAMIYNIEDSVDNSINLDSSDLATCNKASAKSKR
jgi:hypothetical protein